MKISERGYWVSKSYKWLSLVYWSIYSFYFKTLTYFSVANPKIYLGGMLDERKTDIYQLVPEKYLPKTILIQSIQPNTIKEIEKAFDFPLILKPNIGYKGFMVKRIDNTHQLSSAIAQYKGKEILVQEFLKEPCEYSVMYYFIDDQNYGISSLVEKHLPKIIGDGKASVLQLIQALKNPFLKEKWILEKNKGILNKILDSGEILTIDHVGNYSRGSKFENLNDSIDSSLVQTIHSFFQKVTGMNFCRIDLKANSLDDLKQGNFKLLEINGAKSEPLHIYDPNVSFLSLVRAVHFHWSTLFKIVKNNIHTFDFPSSIEGIRSYYSLKKMMN